VSFLYAAFGIYLVGQVALALIGLVRARREDIPAVLKALAPWWQQCDDAISCRPPTHNRHAGQQHQPDELGF